MIAQKAFTAPVLFDKARQTSTVVRLAIREGWAGWMIYNEPLSFAVAVHDIPGLSARRRFTLFASGLLMLRLQQHTSPFDSAVCTDIPGVSLSQHPEFLLLAQVHPDYIADCTSTPGVSSCLGLSWSFLFGGPSASDQSGSFQNGSGPSHRCTDTENMPRAQSAKGATTKRNRLLTVIHSEKSTVPSASSSKECLDQAKKRKMLKKSKSKDPLKLRVPMPSSSAANDVQIKDGEVAPALQTIPLNLPRYLSKPNLRPIPRRALQRDPHGRFHEASFSQGEVSDVISPHLFTMLGRTTPASVPPTPLPSQVDAIVSDYISDDRAYLPTHMVAVWGFQAPQRPRQITRYPVHQEVMQLQRAHLPIPEQIRAETPSSQPQNIQITLPVQSLCLPSPESYAPLARYIYHKDTLRLLNELLPVRPPADFEDNQAQIPSFGTFIGRNCEMKDILSRVIENVALALTESNMLESHAPESSSSTLITTKPLLIQTHINDKMADVIQAPNFPFIGVWEMLDAVPQACYIVEFNGAMWILQLHSLVQGQTPPLPDGTMPIYIGQQQWIAYIM
ncbi:hypothetical protein BKA70DRAFT_1503106 [Coprinopsis sp. MPI-PUGE-AT-0042]|nr:hypothetical protein BKA70DRAFT_1503106 [Coprinopsis sp. MPI-PUGE-AT-0042]